MEKNQNVELTPDGIELGLPDWQSLAPGEDAVSYSDSTAEVDERLPVALVYTHATGERKTVSDVGALGGDGGCPAFKGLSPTEICASITLMDLADNLDIPVMPVQKRPEQQSVAMKQHIREKKSSDPKTPKDLDSDVEMRVVQQLEDAISAHEVRVKPITPEVELLVESTKRVEAGRVVELHLQQERQEDAVDKLSPVTVVNYAPHIPAVEKMIADTMATDEVRAMLIEDPSNVSSDLSESVGLDLERQDVHGSTETDSQVGEQTEQIRQLKELFALPAFGEIAEDGPDVSLAEVVSEDENGDEGNEEGDVLTLHDLDRLHNAMDNMLMVGLAQEEVGLLNVDEQEGSEFLFEPAYIEFGGGELPAAEMEPESSELEVSAPEGIQALLVDLQVLLQLAELPQEIQAMEMSNLGIEAAGEVTGEEVLEIVGEEPMHDADLSAADTAIGTTVEMQVPELTPEIESKVIEILEAMGYQQPQEMLDRYVAEYGPQALLESLQQLFPVVDRLRFIADMEGFLESTSGQGAGQLADDDDDRYTSLRRLGNFICRAVAQLRITGRVVQTV